MNWDSKTTNCPTHPLHERSPFHTRRNCIIKWFGFMVYFQQYFSYIMVVSFIGGGNRSTRRKTTGLSQVTDKLYHIMLYPLHWPGFELTTSVVIGADYIGSCKSNYHTITGIIKGGYMYIVLFISYKTTIFKMFKMTVHVFFINYNVQQN